jgi:hypothetical protein
MTTNENGYVIYPESIGVMDRETAIERACELSAENPTETYRVEDCDTNDTIARFRGGQEKE